VALVQLTISFAGCAGQLALALVALNRSARSRLAFSLALLFLDVFVWNLASLLEALSGQPVWGWLDHTASPLTAPLTLEFVLGFVGQQRRFARLRTLAWLPFTSLCLIPTLGLAFPVVRDWDRSGPWAAALTICAVPTMIFAIVLLVLHNRTIADQHERARTRLLLAATALGTALGLTDLLSNFVHELPSLGSLGFLAAGGLTLFAATRIRLLESELTLESTAIAVAISTAGVIAYIALFRSGASRTAVLVSTAVLVTLALAAVVRRLSRGLEQQRVRTLELATLGRFAAQMSHDFRNPLAALKGAAQYLKQDLPKEDAGTRRAAFVDLMLEQIERLESGIEAYRRLARVEPLLARVQINDLVNEVIALQGFAAGQRIQLLAELDDRLPACNADRSLFANALQNLIRNACEAIAGSGHVTVRTGFSRPAGPGAIEIRVEDNGSGMDARTREQAFDEFFTNKPNGSGLGLSFVRRVVEAHGGAVAIDSQEGRGTVVLLKLPLG
jgi:two-component system sensor histidine kinase HydH